MITRRQFERWVSHLFPQSAGERWDFLGWQKVKSPAVINKVLLTLDVTSDACRKAIKHKVELIVAHHPLLFPHPRHSLRNPVKHSIYQQLKTRQIGVFALHTNFDNSPIGMNDYILRQLPIQSISLIDRKHHLFCGVLTTPLRLSQLITIIKQLFGTSHLSYFGHLQQSITRVVVVAGAGGGSIQHISPASDVLFVTGELKWSQKLQIHEQNLTTIVVSHAMENIFITALKPHFQKLPIRIIEMPTPDPFQITS